jgi:hypothetical protein
MNLDDSCEFTLSAAPSRSRTAPRDVGDLEQAADRLGVSAGTLKNAVIQHYLRMPAQIQLGIIAQYFQLRADEHEAELSQ